MAFRFLCLILISFCLAGCDLEPKTPVVKPERFDKKAYSRQIKKERDSLKLLSEQNAVPKPKADSSVTKNQQTKVRTDTIPVKVIYGKAKIDTIKAEGQRFVFVLNSDTANKLSIKITSKDSLANLRVSQIIDFKNNSDGPFGREVEYEIKEKGIQKIIVSENQMAGQPWGGSFSFEVKLKW